MKKRVLLLEPNYKNKYPPMGLMKLAMYHRLQGDYVTFYKGDLKYFVYSELADEVIDRLFTIHQNETERCYWLERKPEIISFLSTGKYSPDSKLEESILNLPFVLYWLKEYQKKSKNGYYFEKKPWDRVCVTTLFTFYWDITIKTIEFAKKIVKSEDQLMVGGVMASVVPEEIEKTTGIKPYLGCIYTKAILGDKPIDRAIDELPLDYSILDEIEYKYPAKNAYYGYTTRGCVNHCKFCAVPTLEPVYCDYIPLKERIQATEKRFGAMKDLLLLDNNVLASDKFDKIIDEIKDCGFSVDAKYSRPNQLEVIIKQLEDGWNDKAYIRKAVALLNDYLETLEGEQYNKVYNLLLDNYLIHDYTATKENVLKVCKRLKDEYALSISRRPKIKRYVDFNQGIDARLVTREKIKRLSEISINPLRIAFDRWLLRRQYVKAIYNASLFGIKHMSNYLLYNFNDTPQDLYNRLLINVDLCVELNVSIYSFPMKYHPIRDKKWFSNRDFIGRYWSHKEVRAIQAILNSTKGKIGSGREFFFAAFGKNQQAYQELLMMPESFIIKRWDAEINGLTNEWRSSFYKLSDQERALLKKIVSQKRIADIDLKQYSQHIRNVLNFYLISDDEIKPVSQNDKTRCVTEFKSHCPKTSSPECLRLLDIARKTMDAE